DGGGAPHHRLLQEPQPGSDHAFRARHRPEGRTRLEGGQSAPGDGDRGAEVHRTDGGDEVVSPTVLPGVGRPHRRRPLPSADRLFRARVFSRPDTTTAARSRGRRLPTISSRTVSRRSPPPSLAAPPWTASAPLPWPAARAGRPGSAWRTGPPRR